MLSIEEFNKKVKRRIKECGSYTFIYEGKTYVIEKKRKQYIGYIVGEDHTEVEEENPYEVFSAL